MISYQNPMRLVLDADVIVAAVRSPTGASAALLLAIDDGLADLLASVPFLECEAICRRPEHMLASGLRSLERTAFFGRLAGLVVPIEPWFLWRPQLHGSSDEMVLEAAMNGRAAFFTGRAGKGDRGFVERRFTAHKEIACSPSFDDL